MLREFQKYRDLIKRHNLSKELSTERYICYALSLLFCIMRSCYRVVYCSHCYSVLWYYDANDN
jgi:hypothetical protein